ncbi:Uncharacterised protein [Klebsiella pneumoniae]|uniref:Uncharacterized protein n=1 Tax=Klebsiella pneumoniae TaxID=573 RepID=A0A378AZK1_KLEPN|nr:Uncharacterised protein [Klebsiella pneumoniae]
MSLSGKQSGQPAFIKKSLPKCRRMIPTLKRTWAVVR